MKWIAGLAGASLLVGAPAAALAQPAMPAAAAAPAETVTPAKLALVRRYLQAIHYEKLMDAMIASMLPVMAQGIAQKDHLTAAQQQMVVDVVRQEMRETITPQMMDRMAPIYAGAFSEAELQAIVAFYESPAGQSVIAKTPALAPRAADVVRSLMPQVEADVRERLCQRLHCNADPQAQPKPS
jgi:hypothetical protein